MRDETGERERPRKRMREEERKERRLTGVIDDVREGKKKIWREE